jgi:hypothetical protein
MSGTAKKAYLLSAPGKSLALAATAGGLRVTVPTAAPDAISSVVVLEGVGKVSPLPPPPIKAGADGVLALGCDDADLAGKGLRVEGNTQLNLTGWSSVDTFPQWDVRIEKAGTYEVSALCAVTPAQAGGEMTFAVGDAKLAAKATSTGGGFKEIKLGTVQIGKTGQQTITLKATKLVAPELLKLRALTLKPVAAK